MRVPELLENNLAALRNRYPDYADVLSAVPEASGYSFECREGLAHAASHLELLATRGKARHGLGQWSVRAQDIVALFQSEPTREPLERYLQYQGSAKLASPGFVAECGAQILERILVGLDAQFNEGPLVCVSIP